MTDDDFAPMLEAVSAAYDEVLPPIPDGLLDVARDAFQWRLVDDRLAELLFDSATDELVGSRGRSSERRSFRYAAGDTVIRVHLTEDTLVIMIEPPAAVEITIATQSGSSVFAADEYGELVVDAPERPFRLEVGLGSGRFVTPWISG